MDNYKDYISVCPHAQENITSIVMPVRPIIDLLTLHEMLGDHLVFLFTAKEIPYW